VRRDRRLAEGRYAREVSSGTVTYLKGLDLPVKIVPMRRLGRRYTVISTNTELSVAPIRARMRKRGWVEETIKQLKALGLEDCRCRGEQSLERWVEWVMLHSVLLARVRWAQRGVEWPAWRAAGKRLAGSLFRLDGFGEPSSRWVARMKERFRMREPWITAAWEWWQGSANGDEPLPVRHSPR